MHHSCLKGQKSSSCGSAAHRGTRDGQISLRTGAPDDLIQREAHVDKAAVVEGYVGSHQDADGHQALPLLFNGLLMCVSHGLAEHVREQCQKTESHMATGERQWEHKAVPSAAGKNPFVCEIED